MTKELAPRHPHDQEWTVPAQISEISEHQPFSYLEEHVMGDNQRIGSTALEFLPYQKDDDVTHDVFKAEDTDDKTWADVPFSSPAVVKAIKDTTGKPKHKRKDIFVEPTLPSQREQA